MIAIVLAVFAVGAVTVAVSLMLQYDRAPSGRRLIPIAPSSMSRGFRARRRDEQTASPVLYLLWSVFALLVIAGLA